MVYYNFFKVPPRAPGRPPRAPPPPRAASPNTGGYSPTEPIYTHPPFIGPRLPYVPPTLTENRQRERNRYRNALKKLTKPPPSYKKGGKVKNTGLALLHKGEVVIPAHRVNTIAKVLKKAGLKPLK